MKKVYMTDNKSKLGNNTLIFFTGKTMSTIRYLLVNKYISQLSDIEICIP